MPSLPQWFNSFFNRAQEPAQDCKIYIYMNRRDPIVVRPAEGMSEEDFRQLNGPLVFERNEVLSGDSGMGMNGLLRLDFRVIQHSVWIPLD
jgi:hypothetical protein